MAHAMSEFCFERYPCGFHHHFRKTFFLGGGFKYFLFSPLLGEDSHFYEHLFQMGGSTTN